MPPWRPARKPVSCFSSFFSSTFFSAMAVMSTVIVAKVVWSSSHDCCDFIESSSA